MNLNKFTNTDKSQVFHSSGYVRAAHGDKLGAARVQSFEERLKLMKQNRTVADYRRSLVGARRNGTLGARSVQPQAPTQSTQDAPSSRQAHNAGSGPASAPATPTFKEPPARPYNPYA